MIKNRVAKLKGRARRETKPTLSPPKDRATNRRWRYPSIKRAARVDKKDQSSINDGWRKHMTAKVFFRSVLLIWIVLWGVISANGQQQKKPNILVIFGDDIGWFNVSAYNMGGRTATPRGDSTAGGQGLQGTAAPLQSEAGGGPGCRARCGGGRRKVRISSR